MKYFHSDTISLNISFELSEAFESWVWYQKQPASVFSIFLYLLCHLIYVCSLVNKYFRWTFYVNRVGRNWVKACHFAHALVSFWVFISTRACNLMCMLISMLVILAISGYKSGNQLYWHERLLNTCKRREKEHLPWSCFLLRRWKYLGILVGLKSARRTGLGQKTQQCLKQKC